MTEPPPTYPGIYLEEDPAGVHPIEGVTTAPGIYLQELPAGVHPIEGVTTARGVGLQEIISEAEVLEIPHGES